MDQRMNFERKAFLEPGLELRGIGSELIAEDGGRRATVDLFEPLENRAQIGFVFGRLTKVID